MPIYEYECKNCGHRLEKLQKISDAPLTTCPDCEADALAKLVSAAGFRLKGGGWYETDFKKDGKKNLAGDDKAGKPADSGDGKSSGSDAPAKPSKSDAASSSTSTAAA
ncbi:zinc ribbon domain-containing protein [Halomonas denitrificans]|nr:zinc ribbon domain-containing protein [Halomonas denitrificans]